MRETNDGCGFQGWVKWLVVIAAFITISEAVYDFVKGVGSGWKNFNPNVIRRK